MPKKREIPELSNCVTKAPFINLDSETSQAPILRYNVPQKSEFTAYGHVKMPIPFRSFKGQKLSDADGNVTGDAIANDTVFVGETGFIANAEELLISKTEQVTKADYAPSLYAKQWTALSGGILNEYATSNLPLSADSVDSAVTRVIDPDGEGSIDPILDEVPNNDTSETAHDDLMDYVADKILDGKAAVHIQGMGRFKSKLKFYPRPQKKVEGGSTFIAHPTLFIVEEYRVASFLGDYGAGKTVNTFSLLPGERTTITVKTFKELSSTKSSSENIIDSFSESSAQEMESMLQEEANMQTTQNTEQQQTEQQNKSSEAGVSVSASGGYMGISASASANYSTSSSSQAAQNQSMSAGRASNVTNLSNAMDRHVQQSNSNREVAINTTTQDSYTESTETSVVRELVNPNQSRVLNFVFRQLLQEYITITYLSNIKIAYSNGHPESFRLVPLSELDLLLDDVLDADVIADVKASILCAYGEENSVVNYNGEGFQFIEEIDAPTFICKKTTKRFVKVPNLSDTYDNGGVGISVPGVILNVARHVLRTDSVIADSLMGQGEALDCFNAHVQEAKKNQLWLENQKMQLALETLSAISDPQVRAEMYAAMFNPPINNTSSTTIA